MGKNKVLEAKTGARDRSGENFPSSDEVGGKKNPENFGGRKKESSHDQTRGESLHPRDSRQRDQLQSPRHKTKDERLARDPTRTLLLPFNEA